MTFEPGAQTAVLSVKNSGTFDWTNSMITGYMTSFAPDSGDHLVDILDLLDVSELAPSPYAAEVEIGYASQVLLIVSSDSSVTYVSSEPDLAMPPARGWFLNPIPLPNTLMAQFSFDSNSTPQSPLTLTFSGNVVPEFTATTLLFQFLLVAMIVLTARKRLSRLHG
jgi:hypothetical protein